MRDIVRDTSKYEEEDEEQTPDFAVTAVPRAVSRVSNRFITMHNLKNERKILARGFIRHERMGSSKDS